MGGLELIAVVVFFIAVIWAMRHKERKLSDPNDRSTIYIEEMVENHRLPPGPAAATLFRQSGNVHPDLGVFESLAGAIQEIVKAFRRAKVESVAILESSNRAYEVVRLYYPHRGRAEGKKLGGARVVSAACQG